MSIEDVTFFQDYPWKEVTSYQTMTQEEILKELEELANRSSIGIRYEKGDFEGGFCVLKAERLVVVNKKLPTTKRASVLAQGLAEVGIEEMYLKPAVREFIEEELSKAARTESS